ENNVTQVAAVAAGGMVQTIGVIGPLAAMALLGSPPPSWAIAVWGLSLGLLGTLLALPLARRLITDQRLPFPTGMATSEVIRAMHASSRATRHHARALLASGGAALALTWFRDGRGAWLPSLTALPGAIGGVTLRSLGVAMSWSPAALGIGAIVGPHIGISLLLGAAAAWLGIAPVLVREGMVSSTEYQVVVRWLVW